MSRIFVVLFLLATVCLSDDLQKYFEKADMTHNLNQKLLRSIAEHESGLNPFIVGFVLKDPFVVAAADIDLKNSPLKYKKSPYKRWSHYAIRFESADQAKNAVTWLEKVTQTSTGYDVGLMQINSRNAHRNNWDISRLLYDPGYNIDKGATILSDCRNTFKSDPAKTLECYNKGTKTSNFDYVYYSSVFKKYYGKSPQKEYFVKKEPEKKNIAQASREFVLPKDYGVGRTLF